MLNKWIKYGLTVVIVAMFAWAVYDFVLTSDDTADEESRGDVEEDVKVGLEQGNAAPDFELTTLDGDDVKLSDYKGEKVMLNFWASWCGPCRSEMPDMQKLYEEEDVDILAVNLTSTESSDKNVPNFADELDLTFPILLDEENEVANTYQIQPVPTSYMIDSDGIIQDKALGALNYEQMLQRFEKMD